MLAHVTNCTLGDLIITIGDAHIYSNHFDQVKEQLARPILKPPFVTLNPDVKSIDDFTPGDIVLMNYESASAIKAPMAV
jgi:thymidylate synthase